MLVKMHKSSVKLKMLVTISISKGNLIYVTHITPLKAVILFRKANFVFSISQMSILVN